MSGQLEFRDGSLLDFKEFVEAADAIIFKLKYGYNFRMGDRILFRYDNAPDPRAKALSSFPHHKHLEDGAIIESQETHLSDVLKEIEQMLVQ